MPGVGGERRSERSLGANDDPQFPIEGFLFLCGKTSLTSKRVITSDGELEDDEERDDDGNADDRGRLESEGCAADELDDGVTAEGGTDRGDAMDGGISRRLPVRRGRRTGGDSVDDGDFCWVSGGRRTSRLVLRLLVFGEVITSGFADKDDA